MKKSERFPAWFKSAKTIRHLIPLPFRKGRRGLLHPPLGVVATLAETKALPFTDAAAQGIRLSPFYGEDAGGGQFSLSQIAIRCVIGCNGPGRGN
jgi:hypothetical protein